MATVAELLKQKQEIEAQIAAARDAERSDAVRAVRAMVEQHGLSAEDIFGSGRKGRKPRGASPSAGTRVAPKYRDPATGQTWSGRGREPAWLRGKSRDDFAIR
ncbi:MULTISPECIES: H-NS histone family protein [Ramlibacter]|uniref:H-NS histone family protein n=1 Tax=Ramlibacter aquaticus TaxID=2780094 RepID=A0ABR9SB94_9BURK|nr:MULTISPECIES: H-NS histone family protein [Ramlibacter]MBE7939352.1 H-NS histone family protein [Ramlibacter aquaticus]